MERLTRRTEADASTLAGAAASVRALAHVLEPPQQQDAETTIPETRQTSFSAERCATFVDTPGISPLPSARGEGLWGYWFL